MIPPRWNNFHAKQDTELSRPNNNEIIELFQTELNARREKDRQRDLDRDRKQ
jgi:hypothetical protein